jgi:biopolymer transport protein ExbD
MPDIPVNSFADIAFLLIVFFFVAATLMKTKGMITDIPSGETSEAKEQKTTVIQLSEGRMSLNDSNVDLATLRMRLAEMKLYEKSGDDRVVMLETAGVFDYQAYYSAMTAISGAGGVVALVKESDD